MARAPALGVGADRDPGHGHDRRRRPSSLMQSMTMETSSRSSTSASKASSAGSRVELVGELGQRPARPVRVARRERDPDPVPARVGGHVLPARDAALHLGADPVADVAGRPERRDARIDAEAEQRRRQDRGQRRGRGCVRVLVGRDVESLGASASSRAMASPARPQTAREPHLRCDTWSRAPRPRRRGPPDGIDSSSDSNRPSHSLRIWVAYRPPRRAAAVTSAATSSRAHACPARRSARRQADRAGVHRRLDLADHRAPAPARSACPASAPRTEAAHRPVPDQERHVRPERAVPRPVEVLAERSPARDQLVGPERQLDELAAAYR